MKYRKVLSRRTMLRGAGSVVIGLPLLDAMASTSVYAAAPEPPARAFNLFFGLGMPTPTQTDQIYDQVLEPLAPLRDKLLIVRGVDQVRCNAPGNAHRDGATAAFTGTRPPSESRAGGASLDQVLRYHAYPGGQLPEGIIPTVLMGTFFRRDRPPRFAHCFNEDGTQADRVHETPRDLFDRLFGQAEGMPDPTQNPEARLRRSILDSVMEQYRHWSSEASNLGPSARSKLGRHLERIREHEMRVFGNGMGGQSCMAPAQPGESSIPHGGAADPGGQGIDITVDDLVSEWNIMADLYATGIQCDRFRFGGATFQAAGERIRLRGRYEYGGRLIREFNDPRDLNAGGNRGCSHEFWHRFNGSNNPDQNSQLRDHLHLMMNGLHRLLSQLADPEYADENGLSILENSMITISTESGDGRHSSAERELSGVFHAITGANERFRTGAIVDVGAEGLDLYNTMLQAYGVGEKLGPSDREVRTVGGIRV